MNDTIQMVADSFMQASQRGTSLNCWMIIAIIELVIIIFLLLTRRNKDNERQRIKEQVMREGEIDWGNTIRSSFGAETLYK